jgi:response regulator of citrate/malate metabolism
MNRNVLVEGEPLAAQQPAMLLDEAWQGEVIGADAFQLGVVDYLIKPADRKQVAEPVSRLPRTRTLL